MEGRDDVLQLWLFVAILNWHGWRGWRPKMNLSPSRGVATYSTCSLQL